MLKNYTNFAAFFIWLVVMNYPHSRSAADTCECERNSDNAEKSQERK